MVKVNGDEESTILNFSLLVYLFSFQVDMREQLNFAFDPGDERLHNDGININPSSSSLGCSKSISFSNGATPTSTEKLETRHSTTIFNGTMAPSSETLVDGRNGTMTPPYRHSEGKHDFTYPNGAMTPSQSPGSIGSRNGISYFDGIDSIPIILQVSYHHTYYFTLKYFN